jgi:hypothetical protein
MVHAKVLGMRVSASPQQAKFAGVSLLYPTEEPMRELCHRQEQSLWNIVVLVGHDASSVRGSDFGASEARKSFGTMYLGLLAFRRPCYQLGFERQNQ